MPQMAKAESRLKAGCSQDWLPHKEPKPEKTPSFAGRPALDKGGADMSVGSADTSVRATSEAAADCILQLAKPALFHHRHSTGKATR